MGSFFVLLGGVAHFSPRSPTRLSNLGAPNSFDTNQQMALNYEVQLRGESRKSPIDRVTRQNESNQHQYANQENPQNQPSEQPSEQVFPAVNIEVAPGINQEVNSDLISTTRSDKSHQDENLPDGTQVPGQDSGHVQDSQDDPVKYGSGQTQGTKIDNKEIDSLSNDITSNSGHAGFQNKNVEQSNTEQSDEQIVNRVNEDVAEDDNGVNDED